MFIQNDTVWASPSPKINSDVSSKRYLSSESPSTWRARSARPKRSSTNVRASLLMGWLPGVWSSAVPSKSATSVGAGQSATSMELGQWSSESSAVKGLPNSGSCRSTLVSVGVSASSVRCTGVPSSRYGAAVVDSTNKANSVTATKRVDGMILLLKGPFFILGGMHAQPLPSSTVAMDDPPLELKSQNANRSASAGETD